MGKTYGVYVSDALDKVLANELDLRLLRKDGIDSISKLMSACVQYVAAKGELNSVKLSANGVQRG